MCAEKIKLEAIKCRFCGFDFDISDVLGNAAEKRDLLSKQILEKGLGTFKTQKECSGEAFCLGCRTAGPRSSMLYNETSDTFYHRSCLPNELIVLEELENLISNLNTNILKSGFPTQRKDSKNKSNQENQKFDVNSKVDFKHCVKCGQSKSNTDTCPYCGVIYNKAEIVYLRSK
jgi:ribosomal protein L32